MGSQNTKPDNRKSPNRTDFATKMRIVEWINSSGGQKWVDDNKLTAKRLSVMATEFVGMPVPSNSIVYMLEAIKITPYARQQELSDTRKSNLKMFMERFHNLEQMVLQLTARVYQLETGLGAVSKV